MSRTTFRLAGIAVLILAVVVSAVGWSALGPEAEVPVHLGPEGPDRWVGRSEAAIAVPAAMLLVLVVGLARGGHETRQRNGTLLLGSMVTLAVLHLLVMSGHLGNVPVSAPLLGLTAVTSTAAAVVGRRRREQHRP